MSNFVPPVSNPVALLRGFDVSFEPDSEGEGRPLGHLDVRVAVEEVIADTVTVRVTFGLRDWTGGWDDEHGATVSFAVIAD